MRIWSEIPTEFANTQQDGHPPDFDGFRQEYLAEMYRHTGRNVSLHASGWLPNTDVPPALISISDEDKQALMEVSQGLAGDKGSSLSLASKHRRHERRCPSSQIVYIQGQIPYCPRTQNALGL